MLLLLLLRKTITACQYLENSTGGSENCFSHQHTSQRAVRTSIKMQLEPLGPIAPQGESVPVLLRKHISTCNFPVLEGGGLNPLLQPPLDPHMNIGHFAKNKTSQTTTDPHKYL